MPKATFSRSTFISTDKTLIALDSAGAGPGLVILPGSVVPPERYQPLATLLSRSFTVHVLHRRGRAASGPQTGDHTMAQECDDVLAALDVTGATSVFGHSFGGLVAIQTAARAGERRLDHVIAYDPAIAVHGELPTGFLPRFEAELDRRKHAAALTTLQQGLQVGGVFDRMPRLAALAVNWAFLHIPGGPAMAHNLHAVPGEVRAAIKIEAPAQSYASITTPALIMVGARSPQWLRQAGRDLAGTMPNAQLVTAEGFDHNGPLLHPGPVAEQVIRSSKAVRTV